MIAEVQKIKDWISKEQDGLMDAQGNFEYPEHEGAYHILCNLDAYIDYLQEEPVSEELEEAIEDAMPDANWYIKENNDTTGEDAYNSIQMGNMLKAGAQWKNEQMMAEAIDAQVLENYDGKVIKYDETILDEKLSDCKVFDKVKLIIIKEG